MAAPGKARQKVRKAPPKKRRKGRKKTADVEVTADLLAAIPLFAALSGELLERLAPRVAHLDLDRGEHLFDGAPAGGDDESPVFVVIFGDASVHRNAGGEEAIVNYLRAGDAYVEKLFADAETSTLRLTAMCPVRALRLKYRDVNYLLKKSATFREAFSATIRQVTERQSTRFDDAFQGEIAQFIVRERLTFAGRVKIKRADICIECDGCYDACRSRHGTDRLGPSEVKYGLTEVPQNCHNCVVPECLDKCKFGMITRDERSGEIVIADDCTGCTMCSRGCSFDAIRMHPIADLDLPRYFPGRSADAKGKNIAQKCDNCARYADQACVTACPTGALFQIDGRELFDYWEQFTVHRAPGFAEVGTPVAARRGSRLFWPLFTLANFLFLFWESLGRALWPALTLTASATSPLMKAGDAFGHVLGYVGAGCMIATQLYRFGKRYAPRFGSVQAWMESHIWLGVLGLVYAFFHTTQNFREPIAVVTFMTMLVAILTGVVGRYLLYLVPRSRAGQQLALDEIEQEVQALNRRIEAGFVDHRRGVTLMVKVDGLGVEAEVTDAASQKLLTGIVRLLGEDRRQRKAIDELSEEVSGAAEVGKAALVLRLLKQKARLERSLRRHALLATVLKRYRVVHVTASNVMFGALIFHVAHSLMYSVG